MRTVPILPASFSVSDLTCLRAAAFIEWVCVGRSLHGGGDGLILSPISMQMVLRLMANKQMRITVVVIRVVVKSKIYHNYQEKGRVIKNNCCKGRAQIFVFAIEK